MTLKTIYDTGSAGAPASQSGIALNDQPPWMTNLTPNGQMGSVGAAMVAIHPDLVPRDVRIPNNWLPKSK